MSQMHFLERYGVESLLISNEETLAVKSGGLALEMPWTLFNFDRSI